MITWPASFENYLLAYIKNEFYRSSRRAAFAGRPFGPADLRFFARGVAALSELFTRERESLDTGYLNRPEYCAAYLLYFLPINFAKSVYVLQKLPHVFWKRSSYRLLDAGCGPASASLAFLHLLRQINPQARVELTLVDQNEGILRHARHLLQQFFPQNLHIDTHALRWNRFKPAKPYDLTLWSHVLNEGTRLSAYDRAAQLLLPLQASLGAEGFCCILEPALQRPSRELMALRDHLIETKSFSVMAPCLHQNPCPMLAATRKDWCHFYIEWREPDYLQRLDRLIKNDNRYLKVAYLILRSSGPEARQASSYAPDRAATPAEDSSRPGASHDANEEILKASSAPTFLVVSNRMQTRGKTEFVLCGETGRVQVTRLDRDRSQANGAVDRLRRGDRVILPDDRSKTYDAARKLRLRHDERVMRLD